MPSLKRTFPATRPWRAPSQKTRKALPLAFYVKITNPLRLCPGCRTFVAANRWRVHRRSDACPGRPRRVPERCTRHARTWPCSDCATLDLANTGVELEHVATLMGTTRKLVVRLLRREMRLRRQRDEAYVKTLQAFTDTLAAARSGESPAADDEEGP